MVRPAPFEPLETARLHLRCVAPDDAAETSAMMTDTVGRWVAYWPVPFTLEMASERISRSRDLAFQGGLLPFAIVRKVDDRLMGWATVHRDPQAPRSASFGYWIGDAYQGLGYMRELARPVVAAGFRLLDVDVIEAAAQPGNDASFAIMRFCGMRKSGEGMVFAPARERDELCHFYAVRRDAF